MRPHWFASPRHQEVQLQLISRFLHALAAQRQGNAIASSSTSNSPSAAFESELRYTRDPHDVTAVLRWGLRHLQLTNDQFGTADDWYKSFSESERASSFPPKAFDDILIPLIPDVHTRLVRAILDLVSSLAAHSEQNGISGNKLSKVLGWWILSTRNINERTEWPVFYKEWEVAAREFEHLFLAYVRAHESTMPRRLTDLVKHYPYEKNRREEDGLFLPRIRFSTRSAPALLLRITLMDEGNATMTPHPLRVVEDALKAIPEGEVSGDLVFLWQTIRK
ncbi:hypothetical protein M422DRAFT_153811, partial [Sphaerobolus stellatus SS14]